MWRILCLVGYGWLWGNGAPTDNHEADTGKKYSGGDSHEAWMRLFQDNRLSEADEMYKRMHGHYPRTSRRAEEEGG